MEHKILVGTSGYSYQHWKGVFYPPELKSNQWFQFYTQHFELFYKEPCKLTKPEILAKVRKENELNSMELRILNVIYSLLKGKGKSEFYLDTLLEVVHEENKDLIIDSIETLITRKIIVPSTDKKYK